MPSLTTDSGLSRLGSLRRLRVFVGSGEVEVLVEASRIVGEREVDVLGQGLRPRLQALERFADLYQTGQIPEYHSIVDTILNWSKEILACTTAYIPTDPSKG